MRDNQTIEPVAMEESAAIKIRLRQLASDLWTHGVSSVKANDPDVLQRAADLIPSPSAQSSRDAETLKVLKEIEWNGDHTFAACPSCNEDQPEGHAPDCQLAALIAQLETKEQK